MDLIKEFKPGEIVWVIEPYNDFDILCRETVYPPREALVLDIKNCHGSPSCYDDGDICVVDADWITEYTEDCLVDGDCVDAIPVELVFHTQREAVFGILNQLVECRTRSISIIDKLIYEIQTEAFLEK